MASWKKRFLVEQFPWSQVARSRPDRGLLVLDGHLVAWDVPTGKTRMLVEHPEGLVLYAVNRLLCPLGRHVYFLSDDRGSEMGHLARIPFEGGAVEDLTPDFPAYSLRGLEISAGGNRLAFNLVNGYGFQLYTAPIDTQGAVGEPLLLHRHELEFHKSAPSADGALTAVMTTAPSGSRHYSLAVFSQDGPVAELRGGRFELTGFSPLQGDDRLLAATFVDGFRKPLLWSPASGDKRWLTTDLEGDVFGLDWSPDGRSVLLGQLHQAVKRLFVYDLEQDRLRPVHHPPGAFGEYGGTYHLFTYFETAERLLAHWQDSTTPLSLLRLHLDTRQVETLKAHENVPRATPWRSVSFPSSAGTRVQGWLACPAGEGPFPTVIDLHGGPHLVMTEAFSPASQAWIDHGFAYLTINYRGSSGFGQDFMEAIWGALGDHELEDLRAARRYLVDHQIAREDALFLSGESYGAFLTLLALGRQPELWAGGMAVVALADWAQTYRDASPALQGAFRAWFGGTPDSHPERYRLSSPTTYADRIKAPVLIFQGRHDSRTPPRQVAEFEARMRDAGGSIELEWFEGGHGLNAERKARLQERMLDFARRQL